MIKIQLCVIAQLYEVAADQQLKAFNSAHRRENYQDIFYP